jgi:mannose-6-phosphate isomerase
LLASALRYRDDVTGCLFDEGNANGSIRQFTRRLWPQTQIAKAWIAQAEAGEQGAEGEAWQALARMLRNYLRHPVPGGWYDQFDATTDRWSIRFRPLPFTTFSALLRKRSAFSARM